MPTLPTPNKSPGDGAPADDMNLVIEAINTLQSQVDNIPAGPQGPQGEPGTPGANGAAATVTVSSTVTTAPGTDAQVIQGGTDQNRTLAFYIPRGATGDITPAAQAAKDAAEAAADAAALSESNAASSEQAAALSASDADADRVAAQAAAAAAALSESDAETAAAGAAVSSASAAVSAASAQAAVGYVQGGKPVPVDAARRDEAERLLSQAVWWIDAKSASANSQTVENLGWGGAALNAQAGSSGSADSNDPKHLPWTGENYVYLPGVAGNYLSVPDEAALDVTGDLDLRAKVACDDWSGAWQWLISKWAGTGAQRSYMLGLTSGYMVFAASTLGSNVIVPASSVAITTVATNGNPLWVRGTRTAATGDIRFYTSPDGVTWTQLGATITGLAAGSLYSSTTPVNISGYEGTQYLVGKVYRAIVKNGIDGPTVLDVDCSQITSGSASSFTARTGQTVTINRSTSGRKAVAVTQPCWLFGTDDYFKIADSSLLDFTQSESFTTLVALRVWGTSQMATLSKKAGFASTAGWQAYRAFGVNDYLDIADGTNRSTDGQAMASSGAVYCQVGVRSTSGDTVAMYVNGTASAATTDTTTATLANSLDLYVGSIGGTSDYADMEGIAFAVFRKALTQYEIELLNDYYQARDLAGPTAPTPKAGDSSSLIATTKFVQQAIGTIRPSAVQTGFAWYDGDAVAPDSYYAINSDLQDVAVLTGNTGYTRQTTGVHVAAEAQSRMRRCVLRNDGTRVAYYLDCDDSTKIAGTYSAGVQTGWVRVHEGVNDPVRPIPGEASTGSVSLRNRVSAWSATTTYAKGARVSYGGYLWDSLSDNNLNITPAAGTTSAVLDGTDGQVMVEIPAFYYRAIRENNSGRNVFSVVFDPSTYQTFPDLTNPSTMPPSIMLAGHEHELHPAFLKAGVQRPARYIAAYRATATDTGNNGTGTLLSKADGTTVYAGTISRTNFRTKAKNRNVGLSDPSGSADNVWHLLDYHLWHAVQVLFLTEYRTFYAQSVLGGGNQSGGDYQKIAGRSNPLGNASGSYNSSGVLQTPAAGTDFDGVAYRGIEDLFGSQWLWIDGWNINHDTVGGLHYVSNTPAQFADNTTTNYAAIGGYTPFSGWLYAKTFHPGTLIPAKVGGSTTTYSTDGFHGSTSGAGWRPAVVGGYANIGANDGIVTLSANSHASDANAYVGAALSR